MTLTIASFLAGSLLSMLMPVLLLITLAFLIYRAVQRVTGADANATRRTTAAEQTPATATTGPAVNSPSGDPPVREG